MSGLQTIDKEKELLNHLLQIITDARLTQKELIPLTAKFLYSLGASLEKIDNLSSQEVLERYADKPTFGNALMAQALLMLETWHENK